MEDSLHERRSQNQHRAEDCDDENADHEEGYQRCLSDWLTEAHGSLVGSPARVHAEESSETDRGQRQNEMAASDSEAKLLGDQDPGADQGQPGTRPVPARRRGQTDALVMNFWSIGGIVAGLVGILFISGVLGSRGWRYALLFGVLAALYGLYARRLIPESPRWLASQGRLTEANAVIETITQAPGDAERYDPRELAGGFTTQLRELWSEPRGK